MRALRRTLASLPLLSRSSRFVSTETLEVKATQMSRSEALVKEMSPIANFLVIVTTIGAIGTYFASRLSKLEERMMGVVKEVDAKVAGIVKEVDAKVAGAKETADKTYVHRK